MGSEIRKKEIRKGFEGLVPSAEEESPRDQRCQPVKESE
jgi:hypothetical protein